MPELYLKQLLLGPMENFVYLIGAAGAKEVAVIDAAWEPRQILEAAERDGKVVTHLLVTHSHFDHVNGLEQMLEHTQARVVANRDEVDFSDPLRAFGKDLLAVQAGEVVQVGPLGVRCLHTPGHTPGSQCFHVEDSLLSGDTLFIRACGRCDLPGGDPEKMFDSLVQVLSRLPDRTTLYPGHDYADRPISTIGDEKRDNPYLQAHDLKGFLALRVR
jgi:glyoxylase-like metal-dependent hydrolase (beta-lactamase superfamily II)